MYVKKWKKGKLINVYIKSHDKHMVRFSPFEVVKDKTSHLDCKDFEKDKWSFSKAEFTFEEF